MTKQVPPESSAPYDRLTDRILEWIVVVGLFPAWGSLWLIAAIKLRMDLRSYLRGDQQSAYWW